MRKTKRKKRGGSTGRGLMGVLFKGTQRLPAHVSDEPEWYLDGAEVKLTRVFTIVLILHLVAVGGILAFKMIEKASSPSVIVDTGSATTEQEGKAESKELLRTAKVEAVKQPVKEPLKIKRRNPVIVADPSRSGMSVYRVSNGEGLVDIAREQGVSVAELRRLNDLHSGDELYAGKWLTVPDKKSQTIGNGAPSQKKTKDASQPKVLRATPIASNVSSQTAHVAKPVKAVVAKPVVRKEQAKPAAKTIVKPSSANKAATYSVKSGDNLYAIARKTGVSYSALISLNKLDKPELLQVGQVLKLSK